MSAEPSTTTDLKDSIRASRVRVARSRGATSGLILVVLGAWAALIPFIGPYFNLAFTPSPNDAWHWTSGRGLYELLPGAAAVLGGLLLIVSANRVTASVGGWLAAAGGGWLIVGPSLSNLIGVDTGAPDPSSGNTTRALAELLFFFAIGGAILLFAALALGRLSVHSVRDVRAAERRAQATAAAEAERERLDRERADRDRLDGERGGHDRDRDGIRDDRDREAAAQDDPRRHAGGSGAHRSDTAAPGTGQGGDPGYGPQYGTQQGQPYGGPQQGQPYGGGQQYDQPSQPHGGRPYGQPQQVPPQQQPPQAPPQR